MSVEESNRDNDSWSIAVKTVGGEHSPPSEADNERDFKVQVSPDETLVALYERIEGVTGLPASQQRLIYRGRLLGGVENGNATNDDEKMPSQSTKIKDIVGLADGHTIHLVRKRERPEAENNNDGETASNTRSTGDVTLASEEETSGSMSSTLGTASLLAALLGMGSSSGDSDDNNDEGTEEAGTGSSRRLRSPRLRRRSNHRLTAEDLELEDPGSVEAVRQGLMTLHTLLPHAQGQANDEESRQQQTPLDASRQWYRGQWIDCRDTVNQWLEATVVDVVRPEDILSPRPESASMRRRNRVPTTQPATDAPVSASDVVGRRNLLLEPCEEGDSDDEGGELAGYRLRDNNDGVQLLLIHYNGWPHRWDEWIRSDSERIRPFRVRTRHPSVSSHASPTPQSVFTEAPATFVQSEDESQDREAVLPELSRVVASVNDLLASAAASSTPATSPLVEASQRTDLPWTACKASDKADENPDDESPHIVEDADEKLPSSPSRAAARRRELEALAPLLDRLGRTLIDAAPHVATLARSVPENDQVDDANTDPPREQSDGHPSTLGGLLSLLSRDRRRQSIGSGNIALPGDNVSTSMTVSERTHSASEEAPSVDPDYADFATGFVNTTRGEVRSGPRGRSSSGSNDDVAGLLGAYLAAASLGSIVNVDGSDGDENGGLGRLLRDRGDGSGGIDIHIHAIVTAPGMGPPGGGGIATLGGPPAPATTGAGNLFSRDRDRRSSSNLLRLRSPPVVQEDDEMGIFSELYSENPDPVDPNGTPDERRGSTGTRERADGGNREAAALSESSSRSRSRAQGRDSSRTIDGRGSSRRSGMFGRIFRRGT